MGTKKDMVHGFGINDADYNIAEKEKINGKWKIIKVCKYYSTWTSMIRRCYSNKSLQKRSTYKDCHVCEEWRHFSNFKRWMEQQDYENKCLDKDLLIEGNRVYSPDTCIFVPVIINNFVLDRNKCRGEYMLGVNKKEGRNRFTACCNNPLENKQEYLGSFLTELEAHLAWKSRKHQIACLLADSEYCTDPRLKEVLYNRYL